MSEVAAFDGEPQDLGAAHFGDCSRDSCVARLARGNRHWTILATRTGQRIDWVPLTKACAEADIVVSDRWLPRGCMPRWLKLDRESLRRTGGLAIYLGSDPRAVTVSERVGGHPWAS